MRRDHFVLGISMSMHDRAACLLKNGHIVGAIGEERLDRRKRSVGVYTFHPHGIVLPPTAAISSVLGKEGVTLDDVDLIVCGRSMRLCRDTLLQYLPVSPERVVEPPLPGHHRTHAYSAYGTSPFDVSAVLVIDEQGHHLEDGRFEKCSWFEGSNGPLQSLGNFYGGGDDLSLGMFYNAFAALTSLSEAMNPAAGKLMGLAPLGNPHPEWPELISLDAETGDTTISLRKLEDFLVSVGLRIRPGMEQVEVRRLEDLTKYEPIRWDTALAADLARKAQEELERAVLHISTALKRRTQAKLLSYAGGIALNCTTNRRLCETGWEDVYVHPAATDDGNAVGLAYYGWIEVLNNPRQPVTMFNPFTGPRYTKDTIDRAIDTFGLAGYQKEVAPSEEGAERIARGEVVCWVQGESEWGPRALGARSILANPLVKGMKERLNATVKFREPFRPFAMSTTSEKFETLVDRMGAPRSLAPYMLAAGQIKDMRLTEVRHVDGSVRYQVVQAEFQPVFHALIEAFGSQTGLYAVLNTSFNTLGEPLVETPLDAVRQFLLSGADALIIEGVLLSRSDIPAEVLDEARALAFAMTPLNPLIAALGLEAAGYQDAGLMLLEELRYGAEDVVRDGPSAVQRYHSLLMRAARRRGDLEAAHEHTRIVLLWSGLSPEAINAAHFIAENPNGDEHGQIIGHLIASIGAQGGALSFFTHALGSSTRDEAEPAPMEARK